MKPIMSLIIKGERNVNNTVTALLESDYILSATQSNEESYRIDVYGNNSEEPKKTTLDFGEIKIPTTLPKEKPSIFSHPFWEVNQKGTQFGKDKTDGDTGIEYLQNSPKSSFPGIDYATNHDFDFSKIDFDGDIGQPPSNHFAKMIWEDILKKNKDGFKF